jgi:hypothetical protein
MFGARGIGGQVSATYRAEVRHARGAPDSESTNCWAPIDFCVNPAFLSAQLHRNFHTHVHQPVELAFHSDDWSVLAPECERHGDRKFRSTQAFGVDAPTYAVDETLRMLQQGVPFSLSQTPRGPGRLGHSSGETCDAYVANGGTAEDAPGTLDYYWRAVPITYRMPAEWSASHGGLDSRFAAVSFLFDTDGLYAWPSVQGPADRGRGDGNTREDEDQDEDDWARRYSAAQIELRPESFEALVQEVSATYESDDALPDLFGAWTGNVTFWEQLNFAAKVRLVDRGTSNAQKLNAWRDWSMKYAEKRLLQQLCVAALFCLQLEDFAAPAPPALAPAPALGASVADRYAHAGDGMDDGWNMRDAATRTRIYANAPDPDGPSMLAFLMRVFRPAANVVGSTDNTQFGRKYRVLPVLRTSYCVSPDLGQRTCTSRSFLPLPTGSVRRRRAQAPNPGPGPVVGIGPGPALGPVPGPVPGPVQGQGARPRRRLKPAALLAVDWDTDLWTLDDNVAYEHFERRTFGTAAAASKRLGEHVSAAVAARARVCASRKRRFSLFVGAHVWATPTGAIMGAEDDDDDDPLPDDAVAYEDTFSASALTRYCAGLFLLEKLHVADAANSSAKTTTAWRLATNVYGKNDGACLKLPNQCVAVNANGTPCRNAGKRYRPAADGTFARESMLCEFHCALIPHSCGARPLELYLPTGLRLGPGQGPHDDLGQGPDDDLDDLDDFDGDDEDGEHGGFGGDAPCRVTLSMAPLGGRSKRDHRPQLHARQNRGLLVTYKNLDMNIAPFAHETTSGKTEMRDNGAPAAGYGIRGKHGRASNPAAALSRLAVFMQAAVEPLSCAEYLQQMATPDRVEQYCMRFSTFVEPAHQANARDRALIRDEEDPEDAEDQDKEENEDHNQDKEEDEDQDQDKEEDEEEEEEQEEEKGPLALVPDCFVAPDMFGAAGLFSRCLDVRVGNTALRDFDVRRLPQNLAGTGTLAVVELGLLQQAYLDRAWMSEALQHRYAAATHRQGVRRFGGWTQLRARRGKFAAVVRDTSQQWSRASTGTRVSSVDPHVFRGGNDGPCSPDADCRDVWTVVVPQADALGQAMAVPGQQLDVPCEATAFLRARGLAVRQRQDLGPYLVCPPDLSEVRPLVFAPEGECAGTLRNLRHHLHFGRVLYGLDPQTFQPSEADRCREIVRTSLGIPGKLMSWCTFHEVPWTEASEAQDADALYVTVQLVPNRDIPAKLGDVGNLRFDGMSVARMGRHQSSILLNKDNWTHIPHFTRDGRDMEAYHRYVFSHEMYHAIGFRHHIDRVAYTAAYKGPYLKMLSQMTLPHFFGTGLSCLAPGPQVTRQELSGRRKHLDEFPPDDLKGGPKPMALAAGHKSRPNYAGDACCSDAPAGGADEDELRSWLDSVCTDAPLRPVFADSADGVHSDSDDGDDGVGAGDSSHVVDRFAPAHAPAHAPVPARAPAPAHDPNPTQHASRDGSLSSRHGLQALERGPLHGGYAVPETGYVQTPVTGDVHTPATGYVHMPATGYVHMSAPRPSHSASAGTAPGIRPLYNGVTKIDSPMGAGARDEHANTDHIVQALLHDGPSSPPARFTGGSFARPRRAPATPLCGGTSSDEDHDEDRDEDRDEDQDDDQDDDQDEDHHEHVRRAGPTKRRRPDARTSLARRPPTPARPNVHGRPATTAQRPATPAQRIRDTGRTAGTGRDLRPLTPARDMRSAVRGIALALARPGPRGDYDGGDSDGSFDDIGYNNESDDDDPEAEAAYVRPPRWLYEDADDGDEQEDQDDDNDYSVRAYGRTMRYFS